MENKRKAARASIGSAADSERGAKRRKAAPPPSDFDLTKGESPESTTAYGLAFLESIRRTADKSGRLVAGYFEELLPRKGNEDYYAKTPMPISLRTLEQKLDRREFTNMVEFEAWLRRMVKNAKDYYPRNSQNFEDAERVRKAVSNYMTKNNPAYRLISNYSSQPAPTPPNYVPLDWDDDEGANSVREGSAEGQEAAGEEDADGEEDEDAEGEDAEGEEDEDDEEDEEDEDEDEGESDAGPGRRKIVLKTRGSGRPATQRGTKPKPDHEYENIPYQGLSFQQAQEKIVEEMIRRPDDEDPEWAKFEVFLNLPPRSLKDYFSVIQHPLSLKALQKQVKGIHGRQAPTGVSEFKAWAAFEEKASLLWNNAHFYNEEGSDIYNLAIELKESFEAEVEKAKAVVKEPPQPQKIKLRLPSQPQATPPATGPPKKITIVHGGGIAAASPAPPTGGVEGVTNGLPVQRTAMAGPNGVTPGGPVVGTPGQMDHRGSASAPVPSPSPALAGVKQELANGQSPAATPRPNGIPPQPVPTANGMPLPVAVQGQYQQSGTPMQNGYQPAPPEPVRPQPIYMHANRAPGKGLADALIQGLYIRGHPNIPVENGSRFNMKIPAHPTLAMHTTTVHVPSNQSKLQLIPVLAPLEQQLRSYRVFVLVNGRNESRQAPIPIPGDDLRLGFNSLVFDANLGFGLNAIEVHVIASVPRGHPLPGGETCEVEIFRCVAQVLR